MKDYLIQIAASITVAAVFSIAAIAGWNHLFGFVKHFNFDLPNILAVMGISFVFTGARISN